MKLRTKKPLYIGGGAILFLLTAKLLWPVCAPTIIMNYTDSMPKGFYKVVPIKKWRRDMIVVLPVPPSMESLVYGRQWLVRGAPLLKHVGALPGDTVYIDQDTIRINGREIGRVLSMDSTGRPLPKHYQNELVKDGFFLPISTHITNSFDGRYFGTVSIKSAIGEAIPLWLFEKA